MPLALPVAALALCASLAAKLLADRFLTARVPLLGMFAGLDPSLNPGIAFGIRFPSAVQNAAMIVALAIVTLLAWRSRADRLQQWGYGLIIGGALANVTDRIRDGLVTDFFQVGSFPIFNVADSCITVGVILLLIETFLRERAHGQG